VRLILLSDANERSLNDSFVARFLLDDVGYVLLVAAVLAAPLLAYLLITGRRAYEIDDDYDYDDAYIEEAPVAPRADLRRASAATQSLPPRVPAAPVEPRRGYKAEPEPARRAPTDATRPLTVAEPRATVEPTPATSDAAARMGDTDPHIVIPAAARMPQPEPAPSDAVEETSADDLAPGYARCRNCHAVLSPDTTICPNCGTLR
jgi:hypothetical protein